MADEENLDKKALKKAEKERKKAEKKAKKNGEGTEEDGMEESGGSKIAIFFVTLIIIIVWLAILALLVKWDVGGFGSTVLSPILKDVPYVNMILPESEDEEPQYSSGSVEYAYQTLDAAIARIKELETQIQEAQEKTSNDSAVKAELQAEVDRLSNYEADVKAFEAEKAKFYEEVVFADNAPDITEYKSYYESIDPANAEALYKQVVKQNAEDEELKKYIGMYSNMKAKQAAAIFDTMTDNLKLVAKILENMDSNTSASILGAMDSTTAAKVTEIMEPSNK